MGLSPRVRGNLFISLAYAHANGSIPACAGEPLKEMVMLTVRSVYPRVCGGTIMATTASSTTRGLSPRVRGNQTAQNMGKEQVRSIPACAGEPHRPGAGAVAAEVYPRVCGGTSTEFIRLFAASRTPHPRTCPHQPNRDHLPSSPPYQKPTFGKRDICPKILRWGHRNCTRTRRDPTPVRVRGAALVIDVPHNVRLAVFAQSARSGYFGPASPKMTASVAPGRTIPTQPIARHVGKSALPVLF